ncbi:MAG TPA: DUF362 domain-containing protein [Candidatus Paceibacterota bacterium]|nr:DUF362 domain-containing protein [Verrucomicrobiota bacterium]HRY49271.1 DUF362 domain-containing protein [Candidatus Paceibacterota bacterium]HSA01507.1 DUF362 domain-containing protein [Candidatus Paceibacterota bacterium]
MISLIWFLVRVIPKPSRAAYPCQRAAAPLASACVLWILSLASSTWLWRRARLHSRGPRFVRAWLCAGAAAVAALVSVVHLPHSALLGKTTELHGPMGIAKGIYPGRVVWVHAPDATDWAGFNSSEPSWQANHTDLAVVEEMVSQAIRGVVGTTSDASAWEKMFQHFNEVRGNGPRGYQAGEKIAIKINLTTCNGADPKKYEKPASLKNAIDNSPQMLLALLRQLVYVAKIPPGNLSMGDPTGLFPNYLWNLLHPEFPEVRYFDTVGNLGRVRTEFSSVPFHWSTTGADGKRPDYVPAPFAEANYVINFAILKGHSSGITVCGKNHYGSLLRTPVGSLRGVSHADYYNMHLSLPNAEWSPGMGHYRALVDLMGHRELGGKTLLCLIDGLFGGYYWDSHPYLWKMPPFGDGTNGDWPSSLFASLDPVAIDSVAHDFLATEWPDIVSGGVGAAGSLQGGAEDYLHEAALADAPPSGTFYDPEKDGVRLASLGTHEHWNNPQDRRYSRNLGLNQGIELVAIHVDRQPPHLAVRRQDNHILVSWPASHAGYQLQSTDQLEPQSNWQAVADPPAFFEAQNVVSNTLGNDRRFYRLTK